MDKTIKITFAGLVGILAFMLAIGFVSAQEENFNEAKKLVDSGVGCENLNEEQLEIIGDYYMEMMHPGEAHEWMDERMGGEGSESLRLAHINMARRFYCNEYNAYGGMMGGYGMMGSGMRGYGSSNMMGYSGYGMMGSGSYLGNWFLGLIWLAYFALAAFVFSIVFWITHKWLSKEKGRK